MRPSLAAVGGGRRWWLASGGERVPQLVDACVAAGAHDADASSGEPVGVGQHGGEGGGAGSLGDGAGAGEVELLGGGNLLVGDEDEVGEVVAHDRLRGGEPGADGEPLGARGAGALDEASGVPGVVGG